MKNSVELQTGAVHRLRFIETLLMEYGFYNRGTGARYFGVSVPQASIDLADYMRMAPNNVIYNIAATDDPVVNAAVAADAEQRHVLCVRADDASEATAWVPATGRTGPYTVAVHADRDPARAAAVRDHLVAAAELAPSPATGRPRTGRVVLVGGGPGDPGLLTLRGRAALAEADVVVADRLAPLALLDELPAEVTVVDAAKVPGGRSMPQEEIDRLLVDHARAGRVVVRLKGGDPFVFGRGMEEVEACVAAGVPVEVVPGVTSAIAVPGAAGIPVTHRGVVQAFTVVSGHLPPGRPTR